jgi:hypothetical protein
MEDVVEVTYTNVNGEEVNQSDINAYLEAVRESGKINMFGAAPHVKDNFDLNKNDARDAVKTWMNIT